MPMPSFAAATPAVSNCWTMELTEGNVPLGIAGGRDLLDYRIAGAGPGPTWYYEAVAGDPENELVNCRFKVLWHVVSSTRVHVNRGIAEPQRRFEHGLRQCRMGVGRPRQIIGRGSHLYG